LASFKDAGVKLSEGQKSDIDNFIKAIESKLDEQKRLAIEATKSVVERRMEKEYRRVIESILTHYENYASLVERIGSVKTKINEREQIAESVDSFLTAAIDEILPESSIVDYHRLQLLESKLAEIKGAVISSDKEMSDAITEAREAITDKFARKEKVYKHNMANMRKRLASVISESKSLKTTADKNEAKALLEAKTADLPIFEAKQLKRHFAEATVQEINEEFDKVLKEIEQDVTAGTEDSALSLEAEINQIIAKEETKAKETDDDQQIGEGQDGQDEKTNKNFCNKANSGSKSTRCESVRRTVAEEIYESLEDDDIDGEMMLSWMASAEAIRPTI